MQNEKYIQKIYKFKALLFEPENAFFVNYYYSPNL